MVDPGHRTPGHWSIYISLSRSSEKLIPRRSAFTSLTSADCTSVVTDLRSPIRRPSGPGRITVGDPGAPPWNGTLTPPFRGLEQKTYTPQYRFRTSLTC